jgi:hypothetical protein
VQILDDDQGWFAGRAGEEARQIFGDWKEPKPYIRIVPQPH